MVRVSTQLRVCNARGSQSMVVMVISPVCQGRGVCNSALQKISSSRQCFSLNSGYTLESYEVV